MNRVYGGIDPRLAHIIAIAAPTVAAMGPGVRQMFGYQPVAGKGGSHR